MATQERLFNIQEIYDEVTTRPPSAALGLLHNPFPPTGIAGPAEAGPFFLKQDHALQLSTFVRAALRTNDFCGLVLIGEYGSGKTSLLRHFGREASEAQARGVPVGSVYVSNPGTSFADVLQAMTRSIGREILQKYAWGHLIRYIKGGSGNGAYADVGLPEPSKEQSTHLSDGPSFWKLFREELRASRSDVVAGVTALMLHSLGETTFAEDLAILMLGDRSEVGSTWSRLTRPLPPYSSKKPVASDRMDSLMTILRSNGVEHLFLLMDEFEDVVFNRMTKRLRDDFTATLRAVIGAEGANLSIVLASNLPGWQNLVRSDPSLEDRFRFRVDLTELDAEDAFHLTKQYVDMARDASSSAAANAFTIDLCTLATQYGKRTPRRLLTFWHSFVEHFWVAKKLPSHSEVEQYLTSSD